MTVDGKILSRHTANGILKNAGLAKKLSEYRDKMREQVAAMQLPDVL